MYTTIKTENNQLIKISPRESTNHNVRIENPLVHSPVYSFTNTCNGYWNSCDSTRCFRGKAFAENDNNCSIAGPRKTIGFNAGDVTPSSIIGCANFPLAVFPLELCEFQLNFLRIPKVRVPTCQWSSPPPRNIHQIYPCRKLFAENGCLDKRNISRKVQRLQYNI